MIEQERGLAQRMLRLAWTALFGLAPTLVSLGALPGSASEACASPYRGVGLAYSTEPRAFFDCLLREIERLKERQRALAALVPEYERLKAALPVAYLNDNGVVTVAAERSIGQATFILTARRKGKPASLAIDQAVIEALCTGRRRFRLRCARRRR
ncbi:MAG: hypothetical protein AAGC92_02160 [Pseudomonadota bacterium]